MYNANKKVMSSKKSQFTREHRPIGHIKRLKGEIVARGDNH